MTPVEMFGRIVFPPIGELPYLLTLGPHSFFWFTLEPQRTPELRIDVSRAQIPTVEVAGEWERIFQSEVKARLEALMPEYLRGRRWFGGKARPLRSTSIPEVIRFPYDAATAYLTSVTAGYADGEPETYLLPLAIATGQQAVQVQDKFPQAILARLRGGGKEGVLYEALWEPGFCLALLEAIARRRRFKGSAGELVAIPARGLRKIRGPAETPLVPALLKAEQSNTSIVYGDRLILKLFRRVAEGINPDLEIGRFLTEKTDFTHIAPVAGALEYRPDRSAPMTVAILQGFVPNQGDAWRYTLDNLDRYFEATLAQQTEVHATVPQESLLALADEELPSLASELIGPYVESARLLGQRTAELHIALASDPDDPDFAPEPFSALYQRAIYQSMRSLTTQSFQLLRQRLKILPEAVLGEARRVLEMEGAVFRRLQSVFQRKITAMRIRHHGDRL
jgi:maltose alpha-D-glucosyltransferase/alpha-amylase